MEGQGLREREGLARVKDRRKSGGNQSEFVQCQSW